jgi:hypothetical protein
MLRHHIPNLLFRGEVFFRHVMHFFYAAVRMFNVAIYRIKDLSLLSSRHGAKPTDPSMKKAKSPRRSLLVHYHIFKNAGSSFEWALEQALASGFRSFDKASPGGFVSSRDLRELAHRHPEISAISSHQAAPPAPRIRGREVLTSMLIRDPIARIRSIYAFERAQGANSPGSIKARNLSFKQYVEWRLEASPAMLCNYQVHFCTRTGREKGGLPDRRRLERAIAQIDLIHIIGTVARYEEWIALAQKILAQHFPTISLPVTHRNATAGGSLSKDTILEQLVKELGDETADYLISNNELDMCLHQVADSLLTRRLAEHGVTVSLLEVYSNLRRRDASQGEFSKLSR